jgi:hypothetical protein
VSGRDDRGLKCHSNFPSRYIIVLSSYRRKLRINRIEIPRQTVGIHIFPNLNGSIPRLIAIDPNTKSPILYCFRYIFRNMMKYNNKNFIQIFYKDPIQPEESLVVISSSDRLFRRESTSCFSSCLLCYNFARGPYYYASSLTNQNANF